MLGTELKMHGNQSQSGTSTASAIFKVIITL